MTDFSRLIENAFPLKQTSLDSVHEKNVRHGHISTLHLWPARRPLAACRAALIATLLPDPGTPDKRRELCEKIAGKLVKKVERKTMPNGQIVERVKEDTEGGILHWGREHENADVLQWFRDEIRKAYGGREPRVIDPFAGGGTIPLEAMRLGCQATAGDINPVAWLVQKCTLDYPNRLAGKKLPLPAFVLGNEEFMDAFYKANPDTVGKGKATRKQKETLFAATKATHGPDADLAWQIRAWGLWVQEHARRGLSRFYPTYADFEAPKKDHVAFEHRPMKLVPLSADGKPNVTTLNAEFTADYLGDARNPRWIAKPVVAYLWARTVTCKNCRATIPLLKTRWLSRTDRKRILLTLEPNADRTGVAFGIRHDVPVQGGNNAQRREHDKQLAAGTMSRAGAKCPCCPAIMTKEDMQVEGRQGRIGKLLTAVVGDGPGGKEYRRPTEHEEAILADVEEASKSLFAKLPFGIPHEPVILDGKGNTWCSLYGVDEFHKLFAPRQLLALGTLAFQTREAYSAMQEASMPPDWLEAILGLLTLAVGRLADFCSTCVTWTPGGEFLGHTFVRWALPFVWDYCEGNPFSETSGNFLGAINWIARATSHTLEACSHAPAPHVILQSATGLAEDGMYDAIVTDPPYYNAIGYSVLMDFFYIWHRRILHGLAGPEYPSGEALAPKWNHETNDGELVDDSARFDGDKARSKTNYESGMARSFRAASAALNDSGRMVVVFAHKEPDAWETLVGAIIQAGFVVDGSWPIMTERSARMRSMGSAALSSSVWLVCKKRPATAKAGWDNNVLEAMRQNIRGRLRDYWDAGIRGPDFVWAATGPAMEAYSKHPVVKKADQPGQTMTVTAFLNHVRRMVVDYVVGQVLAGEKHDMAEMSAADRLDEPTAYYLLHRHDFGLGEAPIGTCILYAVSCGLSDSDLVQTWDILAKTGADDVDEDELEVAAEQDAEESTESTGGKVRLKTWSQRKNRAMGYEAPNGRSVPLIDRVHRLMHLWKAGDVHKVDEYLDEHGMRRHELFKRLVQSLIELSEAGSDERSLLESLSNHIGAKGTKADANQMKIGFNENE